MKMELTTELNPKVDSKIGYFNLVFTHNLIVFRSETPPVGNLVASSMHSGSLILFCSVNVLLCFIHEEA
ncbi:hypothetical protein HanIR_Chr06g0285401 [Helianthus annuus]|nr:hypothetical protein HanIR_Chr06g0285401 [Helianthus annuus]